MPVYEEKDKKRWTNDGRRFYFRCSYTNINGIRKRKKSKMYKSRVAAKKAEDEFLLSVATADETDFDVMFEDVYNEWFTIKSRTIKETTSHSIKCKINVNILSFFKPYKLHSIKTNIVFQWLALIDNKACTNDYKNLLINYFKEILIYAVDNYDFDKKIVSKIEPKKDNEIRKVKRESEWNYWTFEEFNKFIKHVDDDLYYTIFNFLYFTGLRKGEMMSLNWNDVDFENKTLNINKNLVTKLGIGTYKITSTKTENSDRIIDLDDELIELLKKHYQNESKLFNFDKSLFIFGNINPISSTTLKRYLDYYISIANVKHITPHGFRHSHASLLIHLGCDSRDVANRLGDTLETVENTYYHMFPEKKTVAVNTLNNFKSGMK